MLAIIELSTEENGNGDKQLKLKLNRQQRRAAERRLRKLQFPFPELQKWLTTHLVKHPEVFVQAHGKHVTTNLSGATEDFDVVAFYDLTSETQGDSRSIDHADYYF